MIDIRKVTRTLPIETLNSEVDASLISWDLSENFNNS